jgi:small conductance mechanosensitive channel
MPAVGVGGFGDSAVTISIRPWVPIARVESAEVEINQAILEQFRQQNIDIPFPQQEVRLLNQP